MTVVVPPRGAGAEPHEHVQAAPAAEWVIDHALGHEPQVTVMDSAGSEILGAVEHETPTRVRVRFTTAFGGRAILL